ncbi:MAG: transcriptional repressor [SAR324 cluster bacterium]|nr:transcriptional repressor [SAR324 cluster bacterium]MCZ6531510.1 transcriptional repressor [SAR324 cluster bacterium]MCZ6645945.1 transcriptional repressor [SAR324 cluster bacterium]
MRRPAQTSRAAGAPARGAEQSESSEKKLFVDFLLDKNLKLTRQREAVVDEIFGGSGHFEAEEIVQRLKLNRSRVSRATVYRTLELLLECKLVERLELGGTGSYYEHVHPGEHHDHLICTQCGNVIEFHNEKLENMQAEICNNFDFQETHHSLRIFGLCSKCGQIPQ